MLHKFLFLRETASFQKYYTIGVVIPTHLNSQKKNLHFNA